MKHIVYLNEKPIEEATPEELKELDEKIRKAFKDHIGLIFPEKDKSK